MFSSLLYLLVGWACGKLNIPGRWLPQNPITRAVNKAKADLEDSLFHDLTARMRPPATPPAPPPVPPAG